MDVKHKKVYVKLDLYGVKQPIRWENPSIMLMAQELVRRLMDASNRYGRMTLEIDFEPFESVDPNMPDYMVGLDMSQVQMATDEEEELYARGNPSDPKSPIYDPIYAEYIACISSKYRESKTPTDLTVIRRHVELKFANTIWWNGSHTW